MIPRLGFDLKGSFLEPCEVRRISRLLVFLPQRCPDTAPRLRPGDAGRDALWAAEVVGLIRVICQFPRAGAGRLRHEKGQRVLAR